MFTKVDGRYPPFFDDNPLGIYEKILAGKLQFPSHFDAAAKDLIRKLLTADRTKRLGNLKNGAEDIKRHKFFKGVDWETLTSKSMPAPIVPVIRHAGDTHYFDTYEEPADNELLAANTEEDPYAHLFKDF